MFTIISSVAGQPQWTSQPLCQTNQPKIWKNHTAKDIMAKVGQIGTQIHAHWNPMQLPHCRADKSIRRALFCHAAWTSSIRKFLKIQRLEKRRRRSEHKRQMLDRKRALRAQDASDSTSSSFHIGWLTFRHVWLYGQENVAAAAVLTSLCPHAQERFQSKHNGNRWLKACIYDSAIVSNNMLESGLSFYSFLVIFSPWLLIQLLLLPFSLPTRLESLPGLPGWSETVWNQSETILNPFAQPKSFYIAPGPSLSFSLSLCDARFLFIFVSLPVRKVDLSVFLFFFFFFSLSLSLHISPSISVYGSIEGSFDGSTLSDLPVNLFNYNTTSVSL